MCVMDVDSVTAIQQAGAIFVYHSSVAVNIYSALFRWN